MSEDEAPFSLTVNYDHLHFEYHNGEGETDMPPDDIPHSLWTANAWEIGHEMAKALRAEEYERAQTIRQVVRLKREKYDQAMVDAIFDGDTETATLASLAFEPLKEDP